MKIIIATTETGLDNEQFSSDTLKNQDGKEVDVFYNFDPNTKLGSAKLEYDPNLDVLFANCELETDIDLEDGYIVPALINIKRYPLQEVSIINNCQIVSTGWTLHPTDPNVSKIE